MGKLDSEILLDNRYNEIMLALEDIFRLLDIDENILYKKLENSEITQTEVDSALLHIIESITE